MKKYLHYHKTTPNTKRGMASLYVVIFTTLLLGIVTLSFIRIIIATVNQNANADLSQSAYDSALAGIEDAKVALLKYHDCLSANKTTGVCAIVGRMQNSLNKDGTRNTDTDCDTVNKALHNNATGEVMLQEQGNNSNNLLQAYTCVTIAEELEDYRTTINKSDPTALIPIRTKGDEIDNIQTMVIRWHTKADNSNSNTFNYMSEPINFYKNPATTTGPYAPPVLIANLIQAPASGFTPNEAFNTNDGNQTNRAEVFLYPARHNNALVNITKISAAEFARTADKVPDASNSSNNGDDSSRVYKINCLKSFNNVGTNNPRIDKEFACTAIIGVPKPIGGGNRSKNATFLRLVLPYSTPSTSVAVSLYREAADRVSSYLNTGTSPDHITPVYFQGVQAKIDSTGRANDLFRRVEARVNLDDNYFPYPEFTIEADSEDGDAISKSFYITKNCWKHDANEASCNNNGSAL